MVNPSQPSSVRLVLTLSIAGLFSGLVLVGIYLVTRPVILRNQAEALQAAIFQVLPGTTQTSTFVFRNGELVPFESPDGSLPTEPAVYSGSDEQGGLVGYAIPAEGAGFMDTVKLIYGFDPARRVIVGMAVLDSRETPGLGDKIITDSEFHENFQALVVEPEIDAVKKGKKTADNQVDCITGATISSEAVVLILNRSTQRWLPVLSDAPAPAGEVSGNGISH